MKPIQHANIAVIGAGIVGLAHALEAAKRGYNVILFERDQYALGASVRNFGMVLPVGMAPGAVHQRALRSRNIWLEVAREAGFWHEPVGFMILAYRPDEMAVLTEFCERGPALGYIGQLLDKTEVLQRCAGADPDGLLGGLWSPTEMVVDPREAVRKIPAYLARQYGVTLRFGAAVTAIDLPYIEAGGQTWQVERALVCGGSDFETLYPELFQASGLTRCKLQMLRTEPQPDNWRLGPMLATGFTLKHYPAFSLCESLTPLKARLAAEYPELEQWGIHILASQNEAGEVILGDSHEYGLAPEPFDRTEIDELILFHAQKMLRLPSLKISQRWHGVYAKHVEQAAVIETPAENVRVVTGLGGIGMTTSFGLAQETFEAWA